MPRLPLGPLLLVAGLVASGSSSPAQQPPQHDALLAVDDHSRIAWRDTDELIAFCLYTVHDRTLKLSAHLYPLRADDASEVYLDVRRDGDADWRQVARADVHPVGWTAVFRVERWDSSRPARYRVRHGGGAAYAGRVRADPQERREIVAAVFTGNSPGPGGGALSKQDVVTNVLKIDPDVLLFTGDQVYRHDTHTQWWLHFGETFGELLRDRPTVCLPDDHDVGQPNLWGQGGRDTDLDTKGGYTRPPAYVQMVERQQCAHLPDPFDPTPVGQGIGVHYTSLNIGGIDFALLEDRKFKSGCYGLVTDELGPRPDHITNPDYDPADFDLPDKRLLGERQLLFLDVWGRDWDGVVMKCAVSQTTLAMASTYHSGRKQHYYADFDSNGWPQRGRHEAVAALRRAAAFHLCGDQHLATLIRYGLEDFGDAGISFCVPSIANLWPRWWEPKQPAVRRIDGPLDHLGDHFDGFGNRLTMLAHTNPHASGRDPAELHDRMPGFGVARFDKQQRTLTVECWPRMVDPTAGDAGQYPGWPRTFAQREALGRHAASLPEIVLHGARDPVVRVSRATDGEIIYTVRAWGERFRLPAIGQGPFHVTLTIGEVSRLLPDIAAAGSDATEPVEVAWED